MQERKKTEKEREKKKKKDLFTFDDSQLLDLDQILL